MTASDHSPLTAEDLLASPRGRSLVFALACRTPERIQRELDADEGPLTAAARAFAELNETVFLAAYLLDRDNGASVVMFHGPGTTEPAKGSVVPADVAEKLGHIALAAPTQADLEQGMAEVIGGAMYWQPQEGGDVLAGTPEVRRALVPFAQSMIDTGLLDDWSGPLDPDRQWALAWEAAEHVGALPAVFSANPDKPAELAGISRDDMSLPIEEDGSGVLLPQNLDDWLAWVLTSETGYRHDFAKNPYEEVSGEWWSTPPDALWTSTSCWPEGSPVGLGLVEDDFGLERARACHLQIRPNTRICEIGTPEDWAELCRRYSLDVTAQHRYDWFETTGRKGRWVIPDWSQVAEEFDGVHVSLAGYLRTAGSVIELGDDNLVEASPSLPAAGNTDDLTASLMAGWNPDTTYWLNDVITGIAEVVDWSFDDDCDEWIRR